MNAHIITFQGSITLDACNFFDDGGHADASEEECAEQVRLYIAEHGVGGLLDDWNLAEDLVISVGRTWVKE